MTRTAETQAPAATDPGGAQSPLLTGAASSVPGFSSLRFDVGKAVSITHFFQGLGVRYGLGSKVRDITAPTDRDMRFLVARGQPSPSVDCSGEHRFLLYKCAGVVVPDGSVNQNDWYAAHDFKHHPIPGPDDPLYLAGLDPGHVYACFCRAGRRGERIGHVWLLAFVNGRWWSVESCGGHGPTMRPHDYPTLARIVTDLYVLGRAS